MKISTQWLASYFEKPLPGPAAIADRLTEMGLPVEHSWEVDGDWVLDVEVTSNRADCLSHLGIAFEVAAGFPALGPVRVPACRLPARPGRGCEVRIADLALCPHYTAIVLEDVQPGPCPEWMAKRLASVGVRRVNNVVDITNYVMLEMGQPLHAFDLDRLAPGPIEVRSPRKGESIVTIDGHTRPLEPWMLAICDSRGPVALAGVMGGRDSEVTMLTRRVLLESARFDPLVVRKGARALAMRSEASYRFERGLDPTLPERAAARTCELLEEFAGAKVSGPLAQAGAAGWSPRKLSVRVDRIASVLGLELTKTEVIDCLGRLGLEPREESAGLIGVTVPSRRLDLSVEIDLVEEVARLAGYDRVPTRPSIAIQAKSPGRDQVALARVREALTAAGWFEAVTFAFVSDRLKTAFLPAGASGLLKAHETVRASDASLRPSIIPGLLESLAYNESVGNSGVCLFEVGSAFWLDTKSSIVERRGVGLAGQCDLRVLRGAIEAALGRLDPLRALVVQPGDVPGFQAGEAGTLVWGETPIGHIGVIATPVWQGILSLRAAPVGAVLDVEAMVAGLKEAMPCRVPPRFPDVERDVSLIVGQGVRYEQVSSVVAGLGLPDLEKVEFVGVYRGKPLPPDQKSLTVRFRFRSAAGTLTADGVEASIQRFIAAATAATGAVLRT